MKATNAAVVLVAAAISMIASPAMARRAVVQPEAKEWSLEEMLKGAAEEPKPAPEAGRSRFKRQPRARTHKERRPRARSRGPSGAPKDQHDFPLPRPRPPEAGPRPAHVASIDYSDGIATTIQPSGEVVKPIGEIIKLAPITPADSENIFHRYMRDLIKPVGNCQAFETIDQRIRKIVSDAAAHFGGTARALSCYRSARYNKSVGGASRSQHMFKKALDFSISGIQKFVLAKWVRNHPMMRKIGGVGLYCGEFIHADVGPKRNWNWCGSQLADGTSKSAGRHAASSGRHAIRHRRYARHHHRSHHVRHASASRSSRTR